MMQNYEKLLTEFQGDMAQILAPNHTPSTQARYYRIAKAFLHHLSNFSIGRLNDVTTDFLEKFICYKYENQHYAENTILVRQATLGLFFEWAFQKRYCRENVMIRYRRNRLQPKRYLEAEKKSEKVKSTKKDVSALSKDELDQLLNHLKHVKGFVGIRDAAIISLILASGISEIDICQLKFHDLYLSKGYLLIQDHNNIPKKINLLSPLFENFLFSWINQRKDTLKGQPVDNLFFTKNLKPLAPNLIYTQVRKLLKKISLPHESLCPLALKKTNALLKEDSLKIS